MVTQFNCSIVATALGVIALRSKNATQVSCPSRSYEIRPAMSLLLDGTNFKLARKDPKPSGSGLIQFLFHNHHGHDNTTYPPAGLIK